MALGGRERPCLQEEGAEPRSWAEICAGTPVGPLPWALLPALARGMFTGYLWTSPLQEHRQSSRRGKRWENGPALVLTPCNFSPRGWIRRDEDRGARGAPPEAMSQ